MYWQGKQAATHPAIISWARPKSETAHTAHRGGVSTLRVAATFTGGGTSHLHT